MGERAAYSRVYWSIADDPKFEAIYGDDHHLATWLRLLLIADQAHPASAHLPRIVHRTSLTALLDAGLIDAVSGDRYRIHGLDAERERRRLAATTRPPSGYQTGTGAGTVGAPNGPGTTGLRRDETRQAEDETNARSPDDPWDAPEMEAVQWLAKHGCDIRPGNGYHQKLITAVEVHGVNAVVGMFDRLAAAGTTQGDLKGFLFGAIDTLNARSRPNLTALENQEAAEERADVRSKRIQRQMWERRMELLRETGQWDDAWGPRPEVPA